MSWRRRLYFGKRSNDEYGKIWKRLAVMLSAVQQTRSLTYPRLYLTTHRTKSDTMGSFRFSFGVLEYVTPWALPFMYEEIFVRRAYDVESLPSSPRIIDCGANIGLATIYFAHRYPGARLTSIEADPRIAQVLRGNVQRLSLGGITVISAAVSVSDDGVKFSDDGGMGGRIVDSGGNIVPSIRLANLINEQVDLLKMDIEGSEFEVLMDLCATGAIMYVRNLIVEVHVDADTQKQVGIVWNALTAAGFRVVVGDAHVFARNELHRSDNAPFAAAPTGSATMIYYAWKP